LCIDEGLDVVLRIDGEIASPAFPHARLGGQQPGLAMNIDIAVAVAQMEAKDVRGNASKMIRLAVEAGYEEHLKENYPNFQSRLEDLEQLVVFSRQFETVEDFLTQLALLTNVEAEDDQAANRDDEQLKLSTIHQAKGLEFDVVFVIMLCDGLFPSARSLESAEGEEEERRLMYVAITRAR